MAQPTLRIGSQRAALEAAQKLETPSEVRRFELLAAEHAAVRAFQETQEWADIRARIMGDGRPPMSRPNSLADLGRLMRWAADGVFAEGRISPDARGAYLHAAAELDAFSRTAHKAAPVSPAAPGPARPMPAAPAAATPAAGLSFGEAFTAVKAGQHVTRGTWTAGTYVTAQAAYPDGIAISASTATGAGLPAGTNVAFPPHLMRLEPSAVPGTPISARPWTPDQDDLFADDWRVIARG